MTVLISFLTALAIATSTGLLVVAIFRRPLRTMLSEACGTEARSHFWSTYLSALFVMVPVVAATLFMTFSTIVSGPEIFVQGVFLFVSGGLLLALIIVGQNIAKSVGPMVAVPRAASPDTQSTSAGDTSKNPNIG